MKNIFLKTDLKKKTGIVYYIDCKIELRTVMINLVRWN